MNISFNLGSRINRVVGAVIGAICFAACGALLTFVLSPHQALEARRIERLSDMTAADVAAAAPGDDILITGRLEDNAVTYADSFVAYTRQVWRVTASTPDDQNGGFTGEWETVERVVPDVALNANGSAIRILRTGDVTLSGPLHERLWRAESHRQAKHNGELLPEGSERVRGFYNGDLVTALGSKASTEGVIPEELFAGDRVAFVEHKKSAAQALLIFGLCMMGLAPIVLVGGVLSALFGRHRRRFSVIRR